VRGELVSLRQEFDVDLVVVDAQARLFNGRQRAGPLPNKKKDR
jgi:hypothetical protein